MQILKYLLVGTLFGFTLTKSEAISWYRIYEMFHFQSFHMYGLFMTAIPVGVLSVLAIRRWHLTTVTGEPVTIPRKEFHKGLIIGGSIFGLGWALTGACPGPIYALMGVGIPGAFAMFIFAVVGTWVYCWLRPRLPH